MWDGNTINLFGAKNEVVHCNLVLEAATQAVSQITVQFNQLQGPGGATIQSTPATGGGIFNWVNRPIELFYLRYLRIKGLSRSAYESYYDERHVPSRLRRPWSGNGTPEPGTTWDDRPDHDQLYPEIAVPLDLVPTFNIAAGQNQGIWIDVYIPKTAPTGTFTGTLTIAEGGVVTHQIPVTLAVRNFTLPDLPSAKTMVYFGYRDLNDRYLGELYPNPGTTNDLLSKQIRDRHFLLAHRHRVSLIDANAGSENWNLDQPRPEWVPRLDGSLFTATNGYAGPGVGVGNNVFSIGTYGSWGWKAEGEAGMRTHSDAWVNWFTANAPSADYFLYLIDESGDYPQIEQWAQWLGNNPGPGKQLMSMITIPLVDYGTKIPISTNVPNLDLPTAPAGVGDTVPWQTTADHYEGLPDKRLYAYNGRRPVTGSFAIEDDGVALRALAWGQYKKQIDRWFYWESTYYSNYQGCTGETNVFQTAMTFGCIADPNDPTYGETGWMYGNGDGVLFYPGSDMRYPQDSYGVQGPFASLRLKLWRRGIQDVDYLTMAAAKAPAAVQQLVHQMLPKFYWEYGIDNPNDPTYLHSDISWSTDPDVWETARAALADIIESAP